MFNRLNKHTVPVLICPCIYDEAVIDQTTMDICFSLENSYAYNQNDLIIDLWCHHALTPSREEAGYNLSGKEKDTRVQRKNLFFRFFFK